MKKLLALFLFCLGASAFAAPVYYNNTAPKGTEVVPNKAISYLVLDVLLQPLDTAYSRPFDIINVPINYRDTGIGDANVVYDMALGTTILSCYDVNDSAGVTDSTDVSYLIQLSQYAGDNSNPTGTGEAGGKSDTWASSGATTVDAASANSAINEAAAQAVSATSQLDRYLRWKVYNNNTTIKDRTRCRVYWTRKDVRR